MNIDIPAESIVTPEFEAALTRSLEKILPAVVSQLAAAKSEKLIVNANPAAELLSMSRRSLDALTAKGEIPVIRLTSRPQYNVRDLQAYIDSKKQREGEQ